MTICYCSIIASSRKTVRSTLCYVYFKRRMYHTFNYKKKLFFGSKIVVYLFFKTNPLHFGLFTKLIVIVDLKLCGVSHRTVLSSCLIVTVVSVSHGQSLKTFGLLKKSIFNMNQSLTLLTKNIYKSIHIYKCVLPLIITTRILNNPVIQGYCFVYGDFSFFLRSCAD